mmetsp:Transcript_5496/g.15988  ORF Transcript_5496/g.15988 Transcript_5496/m.15988 type:complete len:554 (-) Transcript_5496:123-1784(-)
MSMNEKRSRTALALLGLCAAIFHPGAALLTSRPSTRRKTPSLLLTPCGGRHLAPLRSKVASDIDAVISKGGVLSATTGDEGTIDVETLSLLSGCESGTAARKVLERSLPLPTDGDSSSSHRLYGSAAVPPGASSRPLSDADLAIQTGVRNARYSVLELIELSGDRDADRASLALVCLTAASSLSAIAAGQSLPGPEILRFVVVWALSFAPLAFVGVGIATPAELQALLVSVQRNVFPTYRRRMVQHEAGHFLLGHLLGMPIKGYRANAVKNAVEFYPLSDADVGAGMAKQMGFDAPRRGGGGEQAASWGEEEGGGSQPYFSEGGRGGDLALERSVFRNAKNYTDNPFLKLPAKDEPTKSWPYRGFDSATLDKLAAVSVAGVCAEILSFGNAEGGYADLSQLRQLFNSAGPDAEIDEKEAENRVRYALGYATSQLRRHLGALDALVEVMERDGTVAECVLAIERCENVSGATIVGDYERIRRDKIKNEGVGVIERILLGGGKNADQEDNTTVEGKGGGDRLKKFEMTGDDPLYAALAAAVAFFVWASSGGLSLH